MEYSSLTPTRNIKTLSYTASPYDSRQKRNGRSRVSVKDRFVPSRSDQNQEYSTHELSKSLGKRKKTTKSCHHDDRFKQCLMEKTNILPFQRVLNFSTPPPPTTNNYWGDYSIEHSVKFIETKRKIPSTANHILNAPDVIDDFYLNLLHWGNMGEIAVGLGGSLYVLQPKTLHATSLMNSSDESYPSALQWDPSGRGLAVGTSTGILQIWDPEMQKLTAAIPSSLSARIGCISWYPSNTNVLSLGLQSGEIQIHDIRSPQPRPQTQIKAHSMDVCGLEWSPSGQYLASGGNDNHVHIWNNYSSNPWAEPILTFKEHNAAVKALSWCPWQSNILATGGGTADKTLHLWNALTGQVTHSVETKSQISGIVWSFEYKEILTSHGYNENCLTIWDPETLQDPLATLCGHKQRILQLSVSPDGQEVASLSADETLRIWQCFTSNKTKGNKCKKKLLEYGCPSECSSGSFEQDLLMYGL